MLWLFFTAATARVHCFTRKLEQVIPRTQLIAGLIVEGDGLIEVGLRAEYGSVRLRFLENIELLSTTRHPAFRGTAVSLQKALTCVNGTKKN